MNDMQVTLTPSGVHMVNVVSYPNGGKRVIRDTERLIPYESIGMEFRPENGAVARWDQRTELIRNKEKSVAKVSNRRRAKDERVR